MLGGGALSLIGPLTGVDADDELPIVSIFDMGHEGLQPGDLISKWSLGILRAESDP